MAAKHVRDNEEIVSDIEQLKHVLDDDGRYTVNYLLELREENGGEDVPDDVEQDGKDLCVDLFNDLEFMSGRDISNEIDQWMRNVRAS